MHSSLYGMAHSINSITKNHKHRSISIWNGTTHTDIVYDDDKNYVPSQITSIGVLSSVSFKNNSVPYSSSELQ